MLLFGKKDYNVELEGLKKAQKMLDDNFEKKIVNRDYYIKKSQEFREKIEKLEKKLNK